MGGKDSKPFCIPYEDALKRVSDGELKRLRRAFKRTSSLNGLMTKQTFMKEVLGNGIPKQLAEHIYQAFGGSLKGIIFKDLLCGLVILTRGSKDEKIKFIFGLYSNETGTHVTKSEMVQLIQSCEGGFIPEIVANCFIESEKVTFEEFRRFLSEHPDATTFTKWLLLEPCTVSLSDDLEMPTFYQTLAGVTHLDEPDIIELEKKYWNLKSYSQTGKFDLATFTPLMSPPIPLCLCEGFFNAFDENRDDHIDFKEMACGISACCRGPDAERQKFCFKIFDADRDGQLSQLELRKMIETLIFVQDDNQYPHDVDETLATAKFDCDAVMQDILSRFDANHDGAITLDEYLMWGVNHPLPLNFLHLLFQVCHIVLGLRPLSSEHEGTIIRDWLDREERRGFYIGQVWFLISMEWWKAWHEYINNYRPGMSDSSYGSNFNGGSLVNSITSSPTQFATQFVMEHILSDSRKRKVVNGDAVGSDGSQTGLYSAKSVVGEDDSFSRNYKLGSVASTPSGSPHASRRQPSPGSQFYLSVQKPAAIDNTALVVSNFHKVTVLTYEGGQLRRNPSLVRGRDFEVVPEPVWKALSQWYGGAPALPREVIAPRGSPVTELELYPICLRLLRHQTVAARAPVSTWSGVVGGAPIYGTPTNLPVTPRRYLAYVASFSRQTTLRKMFEFLCHRLRITSDVMRLWHYKDENNMWLLEEEFKTLEELTIEDDDQILIEVRNRDQTWPEELSSLANKNNRTDRKRSVTTEKGATGLNNLGNTCFMNAALQCVSNTRPLTQYFIRNMHLYELNRNNPLGMKGVIAKRYGDLVQELWSGTSKTIPPLKLRWTIGKYAPRFNGFQQHDSQELFAFLLDGLHEDLNRVHDKPYAELKDSDGRSDVIVAREAWENHILRNKSIIVDLFHGQLKSTVVCKVCGHESVRFDPFNYLSLPLPMESCVHLEVIVICLDGRVPIKYGVRLNVDQKYTAVKQQLSDMCGVPADQLMLAEVIGSMIKNIPSDNQRIRATSTGVLYAYEIPWLHDPLYIEEPRSSKHREHQTLNQIQRMDRTGILARLNARAANAESGDDHNKSPSSSEKSDKQALDEGVGSEESSQGAEDSCDNLAEVHSSFSKHNRNLSSLSSTSIGSSLMSSSVASIASQRDYLDSFPGFVVAFHRKMIRQDAYFLSSLKTRPSLFGMPLVLPCTDSTTHQDLYQATWVQVAHLVSPLPPADAQGCVPNHAQDCDDSLGYEYPFVLKVVQNDGFLCALCPWYRFCRGCKIDCNDTAFKFSSSFIAIDWDPTALHLRYQASQERLTHDHESVESTRRMQTDPIDLDTCLRAFTKEEELGEEERYYCSKCRLHQLASKKLEIWRLPPVLIVHLKRFLFVNGHWIKSQKIVKFPHQSFNANDYLADIPKRAARQRRASESPAHRCNGRHSSSSSGVNSEVSTPTLADDQSSTSAGSPFVFPDGSAAAAVNDVVSVAGGYVANGEPVRLEVGEVVDAVDVVGDVPVATEVSENGVCDSSSRDFHEHQLIDGYSDSDLKYNLYAISCHSGILGGGHYVCYACNPNNRWYCYNDSSCKEVSESQIDSDSAYMLFYEREGIDYERYMPNVNGKTLEAFDIDDDIESDIRKLCCLQ